MKLRPSAFLLVMLLLTACGHDGKELRIRFVGNSKEFRAVSGRVTNRTKAFSYQQSGKLITETATLTTIEMDNHKPWEKLSSKSSQTENLQQLDMIKIQISLTGEEGTSGATPVQVKKYEINQNRFSTVSEISLTYFNENDEKRVVLDSSNSKGFVEINSANEKLIQGSIDVRSNEVTIQGNFQAYGKNF